jgi:hydrogenase expression/formation protein HypD
VRFVEAFRDPAAVAAVAGAIARSVTRPWTIMEVCGGQTHAIVRHGLDELLPDGVELIHGPGCPVCVTPAEVLDLAHRIAARPEVVFCTFADMLRVPGSSTDLFAVKAAGGDVRTVLSPLDALTVAEQEPAREVVFFAVGFETTAPATALALAQARQRGLRNFSALVTHVRVPPALTAILNQPGNRVQGFLAAGHVCAVMGTTEYDAIAREFGVPIVVTGFEPLDILDGIARCVVQLEAGRAEVENAYPRAVRRGGNAHAQALMAEVFAVGERHWRGLGAIEASGLVLGPAYAQFDAEQRFGSPEYGVETSRPCISGAVLTGRRRPTDCPAFGVRCTPEHPLGATMVSSEGACAAYYRYRPARPA